MNEPDAGIDEGPDAEEVEELLGELEELSESADSPPEEQTLQRTISLLDRLPGGRAFGFDDLAQQIVGGFILSAPFVVTEEVWSLAAEMSWSHWAVTVVMVVTIGYTTLYRADQQRDADAESSVAGLPLRFLSLVTIAYLSVAVLAFVFDAPATFGSTPATTVRAVSIGAIFGVVGAATADSLFG